MREAHGLARTPEYWVWHSMKKRCHNPNYEWYPTYGGRGITVCERWRNSFSAFIEDMGRRPASHLMLERIDNNGNYEPNNCKWATPLEQRLNQGARKIYKNNASGIAGVAHRFGSFRVCIGGSKNRKHLGTTTDFFEACCLRKSEEAKRKTAKP